MIRAKRSFIPSFLKLRRILSGNKNKRTLSTRDTDYGSSCGKTPESGNGNRKGYNSLPLPRGRRCASDKDLGPGQPKES